MGPAAPMRAVQAHEDTTIGGGKYAVKKGQTIAILTMQALRDPKVWGEDVSTHHRVLGWADMSRYRRRSSGQNG